MEAKRDPLWAFVLPYAVFMGLTWVEAQETLKPHYPWVYTAKLVAVAAVWWAFRRGYPTLRPTHLPLAIGVGVLGVAVWIALALLMKDHLAPLLPSWLAPGPRLGYNPFDTLASRAAAWLFVAVRLAGLAIVVPLVEEMFWRGFLARWIIDQDFEKVAVGHFTRTSFAIVTLAFVVVHPEWLAALVWGAGINALCWLTRNLGSCVVAHGVTNLLLGGYILATGAYWLW